MGLFFSGHIMCLDNPYYACQVTVRPAEAVVHSLRFNLYLIHYPDLWLQPTGP